MRTNHLGLSILFWLNKQRGKNGKQAIYFRMTIDEKRRELTTYQYVLPKDWNQKGQRVKKTSPDADSINRHLDCCKSDCQRHYSILTASGNPFQIDDLKRAYMGKSEPTHSLMDVFDFHNRRFADKVNAGKSSALTLRRFEITKSKVQSFLRTTRKSADVELPEIKYAFAANFEHYLTTKEKIGTNTAMKYLKNLKQVLKMAVDQGWISVNPIGGFKCTYEDPQRERLTMEEISELANKDLLPRLAEVRDVFLFCCFTGYAFMDVLNLTPQNVISGIDGEKWIAKNREKTKAPEQLPLLPVAAEIIARYKDHLYCKKYNRLLPVNSNSRFNAYLKEVAAICQIPKHLTTHTARHTFATTVTLENDVPIETVSQLLGHKSIRTTQIYAKITQHKISNNMRILKSRLFGEGSKFQRNSDCKPNDE